MRWGARTYRADRLQRTRKSPTAAGRPAKGAKAQAERSRKSAQAQNEHLRKPQGGSGRKQTSAAKPKGDFRPGRAHRAEVARQHSKRR